MKNATLYEKKAKKLLSNLPKVKTPAPPQDPFACLIQSILEADVPRKAAAAVLATLQKEFVDYNEIRVAPIKDLADCMGRDFVGARDKAESIVKSLNGIFDRNSTFSMAYMDKMPKRDLRRHLGELGLGHYASAMVLLQMFGGHAIPVDRSLQWCLEADDFVNPGSDIPDIQGFLERIIAQKDDFAAHDFFRDYVDKNSKMLAKRRKEEAAAPSAPPPVDVDEMDDLDLPMPELPQVAAPKPVPAKQPAGKLPAPKQPVAKAPPAKPARVEVSKTSAKHKKRK